MSFRRSSRRPPILAVLGLLAAAVFVALAASLNPAAPGGSHGLPTLAIGLGSPSPDGEPTASDLGPSAPPDSSIAIVPVTSFRDRKSVV